MLYVKMFYVVLTWLKKNVGFEQILSTYTNTNNVIRTLVI